MKLYDELVARGLIAQVTNEEEIREMIDNGKATFYIGFDPTADSLHVGHFMALCLMKRLQMAGNKPIALIGGGTAMIGDPSGRTDMRSMMTRETIQHNCDCFKKQMERFIEFGEDKAIMVNNADWLLKLNYVDFIREIGGCFSSQSALLTICALPSPNSMKRSICFLKQSQLCWMVSGVIMDRISVRPEGSPIMAVPPPIRAMGLLPAICRRFIRHRAIKWPTCRESAVGSKPI